MKGKIAMFILTFVVYCLIFLTWNNWNVTTKQIAEMTFIGVGVSLFVVIAWNATRRFINSVWKK
jgi:hypothetical protein